jgi:shikimate kinase
MNIFLCGYMGVGKSTVAKRLAQLKNMSFVDLDAYIEKDNDMSITALFETKGEEYFRKEEFRACMSLLDEDNTVVALGGGSLEYPNLLQRIRNKALVVYLEASAEFLYDRLKNEASTRPLIAGLADDERLKFIQQHLEKRAVNYEKAQLKLNVENKSVDEIAKTINGYLDLF